MSIIEETIVLKDPKIEEINKYYIPEELNDIDRMSYIIRKNYLYQLEKLIMDIPYFYLKDFPDYTTFMQSIVMNIMDNIELKEKSTQVLFPQYLCKLCIEFSKTPHNFNKAFNINNAFLEFYL